MLLLAIIAEPQLAGASALAGIGFTMSLSIAGQAFADPRDFAAVEIAVFAASISATLLRVAMLWGVASNETKPNESCLERFSSAGLLRRPRKRRRR